MIRIYWIIRFQIDGNLQTPNATIPTQIPILVNVIVRLKTTVLSLCNFHAFAYGIREKET